MLKVSQAFYRRSLKPERRHGWGFPRGLPMQETEETHVRSLGRKDPLEEEMATPSSILAGKSHGQGGLEG